MILQPAAKSGISYLGCSCCPKQRSRFVSQLGQAETGTSLQLPGGTSISFNYGSGVPYGAYSPGMYPQQGLPVAQVPLSQWLTQPNGIFPSFSNLAVFGVTGLGILLLWMGGRRHYR